MTRAFSMVVHAQPPEVQPFKHNDTKSACQNSNPQSTQSWFHPIDQSNGTPERIIDIRKSKASPLDLHTSIIQGLSRPCGSKILPSLLLWDKKGQELYGDILKTKHYYPIRIEKELLENCMDELASTIAASGTRILLELGAGDMRKTTLLLSALDKYKIPLVYYALDVDEAALQDSLAGVDARTNLQNISLRGLLGTYDDGAKWLSTASETVGKRQTLVWLGSSVANYLPAAAGEMVGSFVKRQHSRDLAGFIVAIDGCRDDAIIECAYDTPAGESRRWIKYALEAARNCLGADVTELLDDDNWRVEGRWEMQSQRYENYLCAAKPLAATIDGVDIKIQRGERLHILGSGKWTPDDVCNIVGKQGLQISRQWTHPDIDYTVYWMQPLLHGCDSGIMVED